MVEICISVKGHETRRVVPHGFTVRRCAHIIYEQRTGEVSLTTLKMNAKKYGL